MAEVNASIKKPNAFVAFFISIGAWFRAFPKRFVNFFKRLGLKIANWFKSLWRIVKEGNWKTRMSFVVMGFGCFAYGQWLRGALYLLLEVGFVLFMVFFGPPYLGKFGTLGTTLQGPLIDQNTGLQIGVTEGDDSLMILLFGVITILFILIFAVLYFKQLRNAFANQERAEFGMPIDGTKDDVKNMLNKNFHTTILALPTLGIAVFTVIPLIFMILIAFTNYDYEHLTPGNLFTWVGFKNFAELFKFTGTSSMGQTFGKLLGWTLVWAV